MSKKACVKNDPICDPSTEEIMVKNLLILPETDGNLYIFNKKVLFYHNIIKLIKKT